MLNKVLIIGNLVRDPVINFLPSGKQVVEFSIAYNRRFKVNDEWREETHFFDVRAYGRLAEDLGTRLFKGYMVVIEGSLRQDRWVDKEGRPQSKVRIIAHAVRIIRKPRAEGPIEEEVLPEDTEVGFEEKPFSSEEDELPF
ncbi:single-stranded DNA-binding protein [Thermocrinis sp.]|jgi:single-strand DNA-binding protein|uniref:single-stranded DNA-binding protein n=1 Tax=Thermocrinis sp. TaxID=2024383 RepID=UPI003BFB3062